MDYVPLGRLELPFLAPEVNALESQSFQAKSILSLDYL